MTCVKCNGRGFVVVADENGEQEDRCDECNGTGTFLHPGWQGQARAAGWVTKEEVSSLRLRDRRAVAAMERDALRAELDAARAREARLSAVLFEVRQLDAIDLGFTWPDLSRALRLYDEAAGGGAIGLDARRSSLDREARLAEGPRETVRKCQWCGGKGQIEGPGMALEPGQAIPPPRDCFACLPARSSLLADAPAARESVDGAALLEVAAEHEFAGMAGSARVDDYECSCGKRFQVVTEAAARSMHRAHVLAAYRAKVPR